jgi:IPT/TIG domain
MSKTNTSTTRRRLARAGLAAGAAGTLLAAMTASPAFAVAGTLSLSQTGGPSGGTNTLVATFATSPTAPNPTTFTASTTAQFVVQSSATATPICPTTYATPGNNQAVLGTNLKVLSPTKLGITVPTGVIHTITANASTKYVLCVYGGSTAGTSALVASGQYSVGLKPTLATTGTVSPTNGPALGGTTITVTGTNFVQNTAAAPNNTTATIGGVALKDINVAAGGGSFTATTPAHAAGGPFTLSVTTPGGTATTLGNTTTRADVFSYTNGIVISPNTASNTKYSPTDIDISGVGFLAMDFSTTNVAMPPIDNKAHVYLTNGPYNPTGVTTLTTGNKTNGPLAECTYVLVVSDNEVLCSLNLSAALDATGIAAATTRTATITTVTGSPIIRSAAGSFTVNDVGSTITVPTNTQFVSSTIASVINAYEATISNNALATTTAAVVATITPHAASASFVTTLNGTTITGTAGDFITADIGKTITGTNIPANTTIVSVNANGTAVISNPASAAGTTVNGAYVTGLVPVPSDAYNITVVNDGTVGANTSNANYVQSNVSSGSTFTVADY